MTAFLLAVLYQSLAFAAGWLIFTAANPWGGRRPMRSRASVALLAAVLLVLAVLLTTGGAP